MNSKHVAVAAVLALVVALGAAGCATNSAPTSSAATTNPAGGAGTNAPNSAAPNAAAAKAAAAARAAAPSPYLSKTGTRVPKAPTAKLGSMTLRVSNRTPASKSNVTVTAACLTTKGRRIGGGLQVKYVWRFKDRTVVNIATTNIGGFANCTKNIGPALKGDRVTVDVSAASGGVSKSAAAFFVVK